MVVDVIKMAVGGAGVARHDGLVIFIPDSAPGDRLEIKITEKKKNHAFAEIVKILEPGPGRRKTPCEYASQCGGCNWQHLSPETQLEQKELLLKETLQKFLPEQKFQVSPILKSPRDLRYRNRIQPKFFQGKLGFFKRKSHEVLDIQDCLICEDTLLKNWSEIRKSLVKKSSDSPLRLELYLNQKNEPQLIEMGESDDGIGFAQVNRFQNEQLVQTALLHSEEKYSHVYDLYSGSGNFTFPFAQKHQDTKVTAVELSSKLVHKGRELSTNNNLKFKPAFILSSVEHYLKSNRILENSLVILDPPRAGATEFVMRTLAASKPKKIVYISCHPVSLARDLSWFFNYAAKFQVKYNLGKIQPFEMFPQTDHMETIVELSIDTN